MKKWRLAAHDDSAAAKFAEAAGISLPLAVLLQTRGIDSPGRLQALGEDPPFSDPFLMPDMKAAVRRITHALDDFEKIAVYGDYDADGVTATAMLYSYLESCGGDVVYYIPEREGEGYGLNMDAVGFLHGQGVKLIVTVDNGISCVEEVAYANSLGMDTVVTDHHRPREVLPPACAVVDPYRADSRCPYRDFAGVGVAFKLIMALEGPDCDMQGLLENYADLAAIGTIGDIVPLTGENRSLVRAGLGLLADTDRLGLRALIERSGLEDRELTAQDVAFVLVPRINATGRMGSPDRAVRLLVSESPDEAGELSNEICEDNEFRRGIENEIFEKVLEQFQEKPELLNDRVLVVDGEDWHHGVIGIVASRVVERFGKPCVILSRTGEEAKGSGRSVEGFSLFDAVCSCRDLLIKFGGHPMAAGLSMPAANIRSFREQINRYAASLGRPMPAPVLCIDCLLSPDDLSCEIPEFIRCLEPFGTGNPVPLFGLAGVTLSDITPVGGGKHLRLSVKKGNLTVRCMKFRTTLEEFEYRLGDVVDLAVVLESREYQGKNLLSVIIRDMKLSCADMDAMIEGQALYEQFKRGEPVSWEEASRMIPTREEFACIYRALRQQGGFHGRPEVFLPRLPGIGMEKFLAALDVFEEKKLIRMRRGSNTYDIQLVKTEDKVVLMDASSMTALKNYKKAGEHLGMAAENL